MKHTEGEITSVCWDLPNSRLQPDPLVVWPGQLTSSFTRLITTTRGRWRGRDSWSVAALRYLTSYRFFTPWKRSRRPRRSFCFVSFGQRSVSRTTEQTGSQARDEISSYLRRYRKTRRMRYNPDRLRDSWIETRALSGTRTSKLQRRSVERWREKGGGGCWMDANELAFTFSDTSVTLQLTALQ